MAHDKKNVGFFRRCWMMLSAFFATRIEMAAPTFFVTDKGDSFNVPESIRYKWFMEWKETQQKIAIKKLYDRSSISYWMQFLYPFACIILTALDPDNLSEYLMTAVGGSTIMKGLRTFSLKGKAETYQPVSFNNGNGSEKIQVDLKNPSYMRPETEGETEDDAKEMPSNDTEKSDAKTGEVL